MRTLSLVLTALLCGCGQPTAPSKTATDPSSAPVADPGQFNLQLQPPPPSASSGPLNCSRFEDVHQAAGLQFTYQTGQTGKGLMMEATGGGGGWLDYDGDGLWDFYAVQGGKPDAGPKDIRPPSELFRNRGDGTFEKVSGPHGLENRQYGHGLAVGDFNEDGFDDVFVANVGRNELFINQGDGTFQPVTDFLGNQKQLWTSTAAWGDLDRDGDLDLFVGNYLKYDAYDPVICLDADGKPATCDPLQIPGEPNECYFNNGDGTFTDVTRTHGLIEDETSKTLGLVIADLNGDEWPDIFVANDTTTNYLYLNQGNGTFQEAGRLMGCALSGLGFMQASMGIAFGDYDQDGRPDLYSTHFTEDSNTLYRNLGESGFVDVTRTVGLHTPTLKFLGFGSVMADFNRDGWQELFVANGHIHDQRSRGQDFQMRPQLFQYNGRTFDECTAQAGAYFEGLYLGRGVASCDYDEDGDLDLAVIHQDAPLGLLRNESTDGHYLKVCFRGVVSNRRGVGVRVELTQGSQRWVQELAGGTSYCASHQPILFFGLTDPGPCQARVIWPSGRVATLNLTPDQSVTLIEPEA